MNSDCQERREELILALGEHRPIVPALREHLDACAECRAYTERARVAIELFGELPRLSAPQDLDGRVVAALQPGFREDRGTRHLVALPRLAAPSELEESLTHSDQIAEDLLARVQLELTHPELGIGRRLARVANRLAVPDELEARLARDLSLTMTRGGRGTSRLTRLAGGLALAAAATLLVWIGLKSDTPERLDLNSVTFRVREVDSVSELNSMARTLMSGVTGGASEVREF